MIRWVGWAVPFAVQPFRAERIWIGGEVVAEMLVADPLRQDFMTEEGCSETSCEIVLSAATTRGARICKNWEERR